MKFVHILLFIVFAYLMVSVPGWPMQFGFILFLSLYLVTFIYSRIMHRSIVVVRETRQLRLHRGREADLNLVVMNKSRLPVYAVTVSDSPSGLFYGEETGHFIVTLAGRERTDIRYTVKGLHRGIYSVGPIRIGFTGPAGIFSWTRICTDICTVIVYPAAFPIEIHLKNGLAGGSIRVMDRIFEDLSRFKALREYIPGDDLRHINWKVSARTGTLHTMEFTPAISAACMVVLDFCIEDYTLKDRYNLMEKALSTAASLLGYFSRLEQPVGFISSGEVEGRPVFRQLLKGMDHSLYLLDILARLKPVAGVFNLKKIFYSRRIQIPPGSHLFIVSPLIDNESLRFLMLLRARGIILHFVNIGAYSGKLALSLRNMRGMDFLKVSLYRNELSHA
ncbi:MAG: DUF58 domain-containing protein [Spirochaetales bacterium]|nr:DUF58 domain-containing protein [Spirochaetales bacterium]